MTDQQKFNEAIKEALDQMYVAVANARPNVKEVHEAAISNARRAIERANEIAKAIADA